jgi:hypothetical protein
MNRRRVHPSSRGPRFGGAKRFHGVRRQSEAATTSWLAAEPGLGKTLPGKANRWLRSLAQPPAPERTEAASPLRSVAALQKSLPSFNNAKGRLEPGLHIYGGNRLQERTT